MSRLVAVSNRVAVPRSGKSAGGLAVGLLAAFQQRGGLWFGWSGKTTEGEPSDAKISTSGSVRFATIDVDARDFEAYYNGFSNNTLWPLLHFMLGFFSYNRSDYEAYRRVNRLFAQRLLPLLEPDDVVWVHDYHLIPLAEELRREGVNLPIGFFLHVPFPSFDVLRSLPVYDELLRALAAYDVVGLQTEPDRMALAECMSQPEIGGRLLEDGRIRAFGRSFEAGAFPIGIDVEECRSLGAQNVERPQVERLLLSLRNRKLIIGVDRLDYSKGLELRFRAYESLLGRYPAIRGHVTFMQIAPPTRSKVMTYEAIRNELEQAAGNINGRYAEIDWVPIRYLNRAYDRSVLMALLRLARVGLVTPIRDGMNLVAKEYVASQDPKDPGVLVLSTLCGAAIELAEGAVLVNPYDKEGVAEGLQRAIDMPLAERRERYRAMFQVLRNNDIHAWCRRFIDALESARSSTTPERRARRR
ncbi:MAG TPA: trehalose-6-phosphate synthase [Gammaproteobacteria bacterium]